MRLTIEADAPLQVARASIDVIFEFLNVHYNAGEDTELQDLGRAATELFHHAREKNNSSPFPLLSDEQLGFVLGLWRQWGSVAARRAVVRSARDHDFVRARRLYQVMLGQFLRHTRRIDAQLDREQVRRSLLSFRFVDPFILHTLQQEFAPKLVHLVLDISRAMKTPSLADMSLRHPISR